MPKTTFFKVLNTQQGSSKDSSVIVLGKKCFCPSFFLFVLYHRKGFFCFYLSREASLSLLPVLPERGPRVVPSPLFFLRPFLSSPGFGEPERRVEEVDDIDRDRQESQGVCDFQPLGGHPEPVDQLERDLEEGVAHVDAVPPGAGVSEGSGVRRPHERPEHRDQNGDGRETPAHAGQGRSRKAYAARKQCDWPRETPWDFFFSAVWRDRGEGGAVANDGILAACTVGRRG